MSWHPDLRSIASVGWAAVMTILAPLSLLAIIFTFRQYLPSTGFWLLLSGVTLFVLIKIYGTLQKQQRLRNRVSLYETLLNLNSIGVLDREFAYRLVEAHARVVPPDGFMRYRQIGRNVTTQPQNKLVRTVSADSPADFEALDFRATYQLDSAPKEASITAEALDNSKTFRVVVSLVGDIVPPGAEIILDSEVEFPGCMAKREDYIVYSLHQFGNPVGHLKGSCEFPGPLKSYSLVQIEPSGERPYRVEGPKEVDTPEGTMYRYEFEIVSPRDAYIFRFTRS